MIGWRATQTLGSPENPDWYYAKLLHSGTIWRAIVRLPLFNNDYRRWHADTRKPSQHGRPELPIGPLLARVATFATMTGKYEPSGGPPHHPSPASRAKTFVLSPKLTLSPFLPLSARKGFRNTLTRRRIIAPHCAAIYSMEYFSSQATRRTRVSMDKSLSWNRSS